MTLKVKARASGAAKTTAATTAYTAFLAITNRTSGATIAGATGITATGIYSVDVSGCEFDIEYVYTSGGTGSTLLASMYGVTN